MPSSKVSLTFFTLILVGTLVVVNATWFNYPYQYQYQPISDNSYYVRPGATWNGWSKPQPQRPATATVSFYQNRYCQGSEYAVKLGHGECRSLPRDLCDWNLSLQTKGSCIEVFENDSCRGTPSNNNPKWGLGSSRIFRADQCSSTKLSGLNVIRSFRKCACH